MLFFNSKIQNNKLKRICYILRDNTCTDSYQNVIMIKDVMYLQENSNLYSIVRIGADQLDKSMTSYK